MIGIVGKSGSGKTTLIEKLIPELARRGYRVGTIKHHTHDFEMDREGKDSWRHAQAGAETVVVASPHKIGLVKKTVTDLSLEYLRDRFFDDIDIIIVEGYKTLPYPKIEIFRAAVHPQPCCQGDPHLLALVSDTELALGVPCFGLEAVTEIVDFLETAVLPPRATSVVHSNSQ